MICPLLEDFFLFTHRLEECTAEKDSLLAVERQENKTTKEELANAQKTINELVHESQKSQEIRKQLEDTIKRSDAFSSEDVPQLLFRYHHYTVIVTFQCDFERFEAESTARDTILLSEKQAHETTKKVLTEIQWRNEELIKKIQDCDKNTLELQLTVERSIIVPYCLPSNL